jgi:hypothetical protein
MHSQIRGASKFDELQRAMAERLGRRGVSDLTSGTILVLPSITFPSDELKKIIGIEHYEERLLCMALLLRRPLLEVIYVTSMPIAESVIDYYLGLVPDVEDARSRLHLLSLGNAEPRALSEKLLEDPDAMRELRALVSDPNDTILFPFNVTDLERRISEDLEVPLFGPSPELSALGSKSGSRQMAKVAGVPILPGASDLMSIDEVEHAAFELLRNTPGCDAIVIKLNNGFSGQGNVIVEASDLASPLSSSPATFCASEESWPSLASKIQREGAVVEQLLRAPGLASPSVQLRIFADGEYEVVSTHDQILGGPDDQVYLGCRFPARDDYRPTIQAYGLGIARELSLRGVVGSFGVDFIAHPNGSIYLSEINLRLGGTTHPFLMARFVTEGAYDLSSGLLTVGDEGRVYVGTDNIKSPELEGRAPEELIGALQGAGLAYDADSATGVVLHLLGATERYGKLGAVCIERDMTAAMSAYNRLLATLGVRY